MAVLPVVRYLMVCDDVRVDPVNPHRVDLLGVTSAIRSTAHPPFPCRLSRLTVFVQLTGCGGPVGASVRLVEADAGGPVAGSEEHRVELPDDPLQVLNVVFRIHGVRFRGPGLYWVQFCCPDEVVHQIPLLVREP